MRTVCILMNYAMFLMLKVSQYVTLTDQRKCHPIGLQSVSC